MAEPDYVLPLRWAIRLLQKGVVSGCIRTDRRYQALVNMLINFQGTLGTLRTYATTNIPLVYIQVIAESLGSLVAREIRRRQAIRFVLTCFQVVTIAIYTYFVSELFVAQCVHVGKSHDVRETVLKNGTKILINDIHHTYVPITRLDQHLLRLVLFLQLRNNAMVFLAFWNICFFMGWFKVGINLVDPFGDDKEDFPLVAIFERNLKVNCDRVKSVKYNKMAFVTRYHLPVINCIWQYSHICSTRVFDCKVNAPDCTILQWRHRGILCDLFAQASIKCEDSNRKFYPAGLQHEEDGTTFTAVSIIKSMASSANEEDIFPQWNGGTKGEDGVPLSPNEFAWVRFPPNWMMLRDSPTQFDTNGTYSACSRLFLTQLTARFTSMCVTNNHNNNTKIDHFQISLFKLNRFGFRLFVVPCRFSLKEKHAQSSVKLSKGYSQVQAIQMNLCTEKQYGTTRYDKWSKVIAMLHSVGIIWSTKNGLSWIMQLWTVAVALKRYKTFPCITFAAVFYSIFQYIEQHFNNPIFLSGKERILQPRLHSSTYWYM